MTAVCSRTAVPRCSRLRRLSAPGLDGLGRHERLTRAGAAGAQRMAGAGEAGARLEVEAPPVERADELAAVDLAEHTQVSIAVRAPTLDHPAVEFDVRLGLGRRVQLAQRFGLGAAHPPRGQRLQEVVDVLVELTGAPRPEPARQEQRVAPVDCTLGDHLLDELALDVEAEPVFLAAVRADLPR